jgi:hypothetical protein
MESYNLAFDNQELIDGLRTSTSFIKSKDRKAWMKDFPQIVEEMDSQLRKYFEIPKDRKLVFSLYPFDQSTSNTVKIHPEKENVVNRVIISTSDDQMKTSRGKVYDMNSWEAYMVPGKFKFNTDIYFDKKVKMKTNFRGLRQRKKDPNRFVLVFEYVFNQSEISQFINSLSNNNNESDIEIDESVDSFLHG